MNDAKSDNNKVQEKAQPKADKAKAKTTNSEATADAKPAAKKDNNIAANPFHVAAKGKVFRVDANGGPIREITQAAAIKAILETQSENFNEETLQATFDKGSVAFDDFFYYSTQGKKLAKWEKELPKVPAAPQPKPREPKVGDVVFNEARKVFGDLQDVEGKPRVFFLDDGRKKSVLYKSDKWRFATDDEADTYRNPPVEEIAVAEAAEVVLPMTDEEKKELAEREAEIKVAKEQADTAPWIIATNLAEIVSKRLYRESLNPETGKPLTVKEYAFVTFGITREYAQNLAQLGKLKNFLIDGVEHSEQMEMSINAGNDLVRGLNKLAQGLTAGELKGMDALRPVVKSVGQLLYDVAPKDKDGNAEITPRLVQSTLETISAIVTGDTVTIDGKNMKLAEAKEKGLLSIAVQSEILERAAEGILTNRAIIQSEARKSYDEANAPGRPVGGVNPPRAARVVYYSGTVPELDMSCETHGATSVTVIGTGTFQTKCKCRWRLDARSGLLVCFEVNNKPIKFPEPAAKGQAA